MAASPLTPADTYAYCGLLHHVLSLLTNEQGSIDRELVGALCSATRHIPVLIASPSAENRQLVDYCIKKFDDEFSDMSGAFSMREILNRTRDNFHAG